MNVIGYCTECHKVKTVHVSGSNLASLRTSVAQGICFACRDAADELRRSEPMGTLVHHLQKEHDVATGTPTGLHRMHAEIHRWDPRGQQCGHKHIGPRDNVLRTRGR